MIPLFHQWGVTRCNVRDCKEKQTTIITGATEQPFGLCEKHYNECKQSGKLHYTLDFEERWQAVNFAYNGHGHWVCPRCDAKLEREFETFEN